MFCVLRTRHSPISYSNGLAEVTMKRPESVGRDNKLAKSLTTRKTTENLLALFIRNALAGRQTGFASQPTP